VASRPTNKINDLRNNPPNETVRTEIFTETFKGLSFKSGRRKSASLAANWAADILRDQFKALRLLQRAAGNLLEGARARVPRLLHERAPAGCSQVRDAVICSTYIISADLWWV
jgi:hypothetical protein